MYAIVVVPESLNDFFVVEQTLRVFFSFRLEFFVSNIKFWGRLWLIVCTNIIEPTKPLLVDFCDRNIDNILYILLGSVPLVKHVVTIRVSTLPSSMSTGLARKIVTLLASIIIYGHEVRGVLILLFLAVCISWSTFDYVWEGGVVYRCVIVSGGTRSATRFWR